MALTIVDGTVGGTANPPLGVLAPAACGVGDVLAACVQLTVGSANSATVSDNVNTGNYIAVGTPLADISVGVWFQWFYKVANAVGTPTVSAVLGTSQNGKIHYARVTGFSGTPTLDIAISQNFSVDTAATTVAMNPGSTASNNEALLLLFKSATTLTAEPASWVNITGSSNNGAHSMVAATSGTSGAFNGTLTTAGKQNGAFFGISDAAAPYLPFTRQQWFSEDTVVTF